MFPSTLFPQFLSRDTQSYRFQLRLLGHTAQITRLTFSVDGELLASGSADQTVKIWDSSTFQCLHTLTQDEFGWGQITALKWFYDPKYDRVLAIGTGRGYVIFFRANNNKMFKIYSEVICRNIPIEDFDFDSSSRQFAVAEHSGRVHSFELSPDYRLGAQWVAEVSPTHIVRTVRLIADDAHAYILNTGKCITLNRQTGKQTDERRFATAAGDVAFSPDVKHILVDTLLSSFDLYTSDSFEKITSFKLSPSRLNKVKIGSFIEDGTAIACPNYLQDVVSIFKTTSPTARETLRHEQVRVVASCSSLTHHVICSGGKANGNIYVWRKRIHEGRAEPYSPACNFQTAFNIIMILLVLVLMSANWAPQSINVLPFASATTDEVAGQTSTLGDPTPLQSGQPRDAPTPSPSSVMLISTVVISITPRSEREVMRFKIWCFPQCKRYMLLSNY
ncbi:WD40-repeat-containing domain protein [Coprinopsis sp. MPI-PUGE-AT-0042]|nr:WD40-repeat-containing domain protein [Coprinopsis sp. MPI-PUGE-AT-0042]